MSCNPETVLDMPSTFKLALSLTAASAILIGSMFYKQQPAAQQDEIQHQQTATWVVADLLDRKAATEPVSQERQAKHEACARDIRADYDDNPAAGLRLDR